MDVTNKRTSRVPRGSQATAHRVHHTKRREKHGCKSVPEGRAKLKEICNVSDAADPVFGMSEHVDLCGVGTKVPQRQSLEEVMKRLYVGMNGALIKLQLLATSRNHFV